jgi:ArsR family transcriptional regulator
MVIDMREEVCDCNIIHKEVVESTKKKMLNDNMFNKVGTFFKIVGDDTRLKILYALDNNEMCVCDIANLLNMTKSSISHQLRLLKDNGLVRSRKVGKEVYYMLDDEHVSNVVEIASIHVIHKEEE